jgi:hypothetical protein
MGQRAATRLAPAVDGPRAHFPAPSPPNPRRKLGVSAFVEIRSLREVPELCRSHLTRRCPPRHPSAQLAPQCRGRPQASGAAADPESARRLTARRTPPPSASARHPRAQVRRNDDLRLRRVRCLQESQEQLHVVLVGVLLLGLVQNDEARVMAGTDPGSVSEGQDVGSNKTRVVTRRSK